MLQSRVTRVRARGIGFARPASVSWNTAAKRTGVHTVWFVTNNIGDNPDNRLVITYIAVRPDAATAQVRGLQDCVTSRQVRCKQLLGFKSFELATSFRLF
jgi:hypothetical protein